MSPLVTPSGRDSRTIRWDIQAPLRMLELYSISIGGITERCWVGDDDGQRFSMFASVDGGSLHISIAHSSRYPTWDEIKLVRNWGFPEETEVVMVLARKSEYVNLHPNCFHLWESACGREGR